MKAQYAILRFAKYKGPEIGHIESHNERTKEKYASNPDVDTSRSHLNFHLVTPQRKYRAEAEKQIAEAGCRTRSDSVRVVEALVTASPEFFNGKKKGEVKAYFQEALDFIQKHQSKDTIISAVVHMDEKTPHMHLCFVPLTADKRLSAKEIVGNKKKLTHSGRIDFGSTWSKNTPTWSAARAPAKPDEITSRRGCSRRPCT